MLYPVFIDLVYGIRGKFIDNKPAPGGDEKTVIPHYYPANRPMGAVKYPEACPEEGVIGPLTPSSKDVPGRPAEMVVVVSTTKGEAPLLDKLKLDIDNNFEELRQQIRDAQTRKERETIRRQTEQDPSEQQKREKEQQRSPGQGRQRPAGQTPDRNRRRGRNRFQ